jgi:hypothetical protein
MSEVATEKIFSAITNFVKDLGDSFAAESHSLALYERLIVKTTLMHKDAVEKHINTFRTFYTSSKDNILTKTPSFSENITYSTKVYINMNDIFRLEMDNDTRAAIWNHIQLISALIDPSIKDIVITHSRTPIISTIEGDSEEDRFLNKVISKVQEHVTDETTNPQEAISTILSSDLIPELIGSINNGMSNGTFNLGKMVSSVEKMVGGMGGGGDAGEAMGMLRGMMNMMKAV